MNLYESFAQATQLGDLHTCLMMDMKACQEDDVRLLCYLTPSIYTEVSAPGSLGGCEHNIGVSWQPPGYMLGGGNKNLGIFTVVQSTLGIQQPCEAGEIVPPPVCRGGEACNGGIIVHKLTTKALQPSSGAAFGAGDCLPFRDGGPFQASTPLCPPFQSLLLLLLP